MRKTRLLIITASAIAVLGSSLWLLPMTTYKTANEIPYGCEVLCTDDSISTPAIKSVSITHNGQGIKIKNNGTSQLNCDIIAVSDHFYSDAVLRPGESKTFDYKDFTYRNVRLDTRHIKPDNLSLQCTANGINYASKYALQ